MADVLIYWRDHAANWAGEADGEGMYRWHSSAKCVAELQPGDRMWMVASGKGLKDRRDACATLPEQACLRACLSSDGRQATHRQAAFLVGVWAVREVIDNPGDDPAYPSEHYRTRVVADPSNSVMLSDPVPVDHVLRPAGRDRALSIGRFLQGPRVLSDEKKRLLRAAAGGELAAQWLRRRAS